MTRLAAPMNGSAPVALVTGGNRGLGLETCRLLARRGIVVALASRSRRDGEKAARLLNQDESLRVIAMTLDVDDARSVRRVRDSILKRYGRLDILINNAAVLLDKDPFNERSRNNSMTKVSADILASTLDTNLFGPLRLCQAFLPGMLRRGYGRIVNVSSGDSRLDESTRGRPAYRLSKVSLNALTRLFAGELAGTNVLVNAVCPGWLSTRMGGRAAPRTAAQGAADVVRLALLPEDGPQGRFFSGETEIPW